MIKEKETFISINGINTKCFVYSDVDNDLTSETIKNYVVNSFNETNIPVIITNDELQYSTGFMKSETCPCLVISSAERGDDVYKYVLAIKKNYEANGTVVYCCWGGKSKSVELSEEIQKTANKYNKGIDKQNKKYNRSSRNGDLLGMVGNLIGGAITNKLRGSKMDKLVEERNRAQIGEAEYYTNVVAVIENMMIKISEQYDLFEQTYNR